ncbi:MAG: RHS repeat-associated core domain-containing protein [Phycisphaerae bacterium]|nr:RHS repeat-associated core domain-containing protein [Phycisphaerae bacterium]
MIRDEVGTYLYDYDCENRLTRVRRAGDWGYETGLLAVGPETLAPPSAGWQHVGERWYDPATGRFLQRDPIGIVGGTNRFLYARLKPVLAVDPLGLWTFGVGIQLQINLFGLDVSVNIGIHVDQDLNVKVIRTRGAGVSGGSSVSGGVTCTATTAPGVSDLVGAGSEIGANVGLFNGAVVSGGPTSIEEPGNPFVGLQLGVGFGCGNSGYAEVTVSDEIQ